LLKSTNRLNVIGIEAYRLNEEKQLIFLKKISQSEINDISWLLSKKIEVFGLEKENKVESFALKVCLEKQDIYVYQSIM